MLRGNEPLAAALLEPPARAGRRDAHATRTLLALACALVLTVLVSVAASLAATWPVLPLLVLAESAASDPQSNDTLLFIIDFIAGGTAGAIAKTVAAPIERVKLLIQTQDANPLIRSGEVERYTSMADGFRRVYVEQGFLAFWRGNLPNVLRYFPIAAFNFAFKDAIEALFPKFNPKTQLLQFGLVNLLAGGIAGALSLTLVFPLDYARTRLAADVGEHQRQFQGMTDCLVKTMAANGIFALYKGYAISVVGIFFCARPLHALFALAQHVPARGACVHPARRCRDGAARAVACRRALTCVCVCVCVPRLDAQTARRTLDSLTRSRGSIRTSTRRAPRWAPTSWPCSAPSSSRRLWPSSPRA